METWDDVPADLSFKLRYLHGVFRSFRGLANAAARNDTVTWTKSHPEAWDLVTTIMREMRQNAR